MDQFNRRALFVLTILVLIGAIVLRCALIRHDRETIQRPTADKSPSSKKPR